MTDVPETGGQNVRIHAAARSGGTRRVWLVVPALIALVALAGCGSSSSSTTTKEETTPTTTPATTKAATTPASGASGGGSTLALSANPSGQLEYNTKSLSAKAGKVTINFTNSSPLSHNVTVESSSGQQLGGTPTFAGGSKSVSLELKPGTYKFFCTVPGHRQAGMEGTLTVQ
jgi:plastocyanin